MAVSEPIAVALYNALAQSQGLNEKWRDFAWRLWGEFGVKHTYTHADGRIDLLLRTIETETLGRLTRQQTEIDLIPDFQIALSRYWVFSMYESVRLAHESKPTSQALTNLRRRLELVRVPLAKMEIANDLKIKEPVLLERIGEGPRDVRPYSADERIPFNPVTGICTDTGSVVWYVIDAKTRSNVSISRRMISDECLALKGDVPSEDPLTLHDLAGKLDVLRVECQKCGRAWGHPVSSSPETRMSRWEAR